MYNQRTFKSVASIRPECIAKSICRYNLSPVFCKYNKKSQFFGSKRTLFSFISYCTSLYRYGSLTQTYHIYIFFQMISPSKHCPYSKQQFLWKKWLCNIIICSKSKSMESVYIFIPCRKKNYRHFIHIPFFLHIFI